MSVRSEPGSPGAADAGRLGAGLPAASAVPEVGAGRAAIHDVGRAGELIAIEGRFPRAWRAAKPFIGQLSQFGCGRLEEIKAACLRGSSELVVFCDRRGVEGTCFGAGIVSGEHLNGERYVIASLHLRRSVRDLSRFGAFLVWSGSFVAAHAVCIATPRRCRLDGFETRFDCEISAYGHLRRLEIIN